MIFGALCLDGDWRTIHPGTYGDLDLIGAKLHEIIRVHRVGLDVD